MLRGALTLLALELLGWSSPSRSSSLWRLDVDEAKIVNAAAHSLEQPPPPPLDTADLVFDIVSSTVPCGRTWTKRPSFEHRLDHNRLRDGTATTKASDSGANGNNNNNNNNNSNNNNKEDDEPLDCGKAVNFTYYDNLVGVARRHRHPNVPDPQVALIFSSYSSRQRGGGSNSNSGSSSSSSSSPKDVDVDALERRLRKAKREKPKSVQLYNQIGNFWRIKGDTRQSIECFRRALAVSPHNAEVLLNLGRVLFVLQYLDDAIYLTRRSLEVQPPDRSAWQQYFTLGEIFKAYGHYQEATVHLRHALELRPDFEPAQRALKEIDSIPEATVHMYTLIIIICLVMGVLLVILSSVDSGVEAEEHKMQRHFNRAMAMRSLRSMAVPPSRILRSKKGAP